MYSIHPPASPTAWLIEVRVSQSGKFTYTAAGSGSDATSLHPHIGDTVSWFVVKEPGIPTAFQIDFPPFNPFGFKNRSIRSNFHPTPPLKVSLPPNYHGDLVFKYTVSIDNGWSDDPDVEPELSGGSDHHVPPSVVLLVPHDDTATFTLVPDPTPPFPAGLVTWQWQGDPPDEFTLSFNSPIPPGWPTTTQGPGVRIALNLTAGSGSYTIETTGYGSTTGYLNIV